MCDALGIIKYEDATVDVTGLQDYRPIPSLTFLGRYRLIDFVMSNMTNSGISHVQVYVKNKPRSVYEHLGTGRHYNINSKHGKLRIMHGEEPVQSPVYNTDIRSFIDNIQFIEEVNREYVILAPSYMVYTIDFNKVVEYHQESDAEITIVYKATDQANDVFLGCDSLLINKEKQVIGIEKNLGKYKNRNISLEAYIMKKDLFVELIKRAEKTSSLYWFNDIIMEVLDEYRIMGYAHKGLVYSINSLAEFHRTHLELTNYENSQKLFNPEWPILTRTSDSPPVKYGEKAIVENSLIANGCLIEGTVINSVIGRGATVEADTVIINSIILPGAIIKKGIHLEHVVVDKNAVIEKVKELKGSLKAPVYVRRRDHI